MVGRRVCGGKKKHKISTEEMEKSVQVRPQSINRKRESIKENATEKKKEEAEKYVKERRAGEK